ncbi:MAG: polyprenyl synthetase family protein [Elusimicrobiota bacterium]
MKLFIAESLKKALSSDLDQLNENLEKLAKTTDGYLGDLLKFVLIGSGKRVRPALVFLASRLANPQKNDVFTVAQAVELVHIATLVHDDVIDHSALRRGQKTVSEQEGVDTAVLLGDHIFTYAFQKVAQLGNPLLIQLLAGSTALMCSGEIEQLKARYKFDLSEQDYMSFITKKTATLFGVSARSGAVLAGQDLTIQRALEDFGIELGIAFQIKDDLLDLTGDESIVGKTLRTDLNNGKMTLPLIHYRNQLKSNEQVSSLIENLKHPNGQLTQLIDQMKEAGSIRYADETAKDYVKKAMSRLDALPEGSPKDLLHNLAEILLDRNS